MAKGVDIIAALVRFEQPDPHVGQPVLDVKLEGWGGFHFSFLPLCAAESCFDFPILPRRQLHTVLELESEGRVLALDLVEGGSQLSSQSPGDLEGFDADGDGIIGVHSGNGEGWTSRSFSIAGLYSLRNHPRERHVCRPSGPVGVYQTLSLWTPTISTFSLVSL